MSIDRTSPLKPVSTVQPRETTDAPVTNTRAAKTTASTSTSVTLSDAQAKLMQPGSSDINLERVEALKLAIRNGELKMDTGKIADAYAEKYPNIVKRSKTCRVTDRMTRLAEILDQMSAVLNDLKTVMDQEQQHLSMGQINGSQLQWITEQKSSLLATLDYLEQLRKKEPNTANSVDISQRWQEITVKTQQLRQMNQHNGWLLEGQIERNQQALEMLKPHQEPTLYGANGQTSTTHRGGKKISI